MTISELLKCNPTVTKVFIKQKMLCVGCPAQAYHMIEDAARLYGFTEFDLLKSLQEAVQAGATDDKTGKEVENLKIGKKIKKKGDKRVSTKN